MNMITRSPHRGQVDSGKNSRLSDSLSGCRSITFGLIVGMVAGLASGLSGCQSLPSLSAATLPAAAPPHSLFPSSVDDAGIIEVADNSPTDAASVAIFEGGGFTVTITGIGSNASYRGCNARQDCLEIPQVSFYSQGLYTWENGDYAYVIAPERRQGRPTGNYQLQVFNPDSGTIVDTILTPVSGELAFEPEAIAAFFQASANLSSCTNESFFDWDMSQQFSAAYTVNGDDAIVEVRCILGAYQGSYEYWLYQPNSPGSQWQLLSFTNYRTNENGVQAFVQEQELGGLPTFDPATGRLRVFRKYRGVGDCGAYQEYQWRGDRFELLVYREKPECDGNYVEPADYPQIYPN